MVAQTQVASTFSVQKYTFIATDVTNAAGTLTIPGSGGGVYPMLSDGSVIGMTFRGSGTVGGTLTTGTLTPVVMVNGATIAAFPSTAPDIMVSQAGGVYQQAARKPGYTFQAGATLGLSWTKAGTVAPSGVLDVTAEVWVVHEELRY